MVNISCKSSSSFTETPFKSQTTDSPSPALSMSMSILPSDPISSLAQLRTDSKLARSSNLYSTVPVCLSVLNSSWISDTAFLALFESRCRHVPVGPQIYAVWLAGDNLITRLHYWQFLIVSPVSVPAEDDDASAPPVHVLGRFVADSRVAARDYHSLAIQSLPWLERRPAHVLQEHEAFWVWILYVSQYHLWNLIKLSKCCCLYLWILTQKPGARFNWKKTLTKILMKILTKVKFEKETCTNYFFLNFLS